MGITREECILFEVFIELFEWKKGANYNFLNDFWREKKLFELYKMTKKNISSENQLTKKV